MIIVTETLESCVFFEADTAIRLIIFYIMDSPVPSYHKTSTRESAIFYS